MDEEAFELRPGQVVDRLLGGCLDSKPAQCR
jgi:hypothetical protein